LLVEQAEARLKQAQGAAAVAGAALHEADAALARVRADAALAVCEARLAQLIAECELAGATAQGERFRATAQDVAAALATRDAAGSALNQLRALRAPLVAKLDAAVAAADLAAKQPFWDSEKKLAAAALAEATAARDLALAEHDARVNTAAGELAVLEARLAAVRAQGEIREREASPAAVVAAAKARVTAEGERASAVKKRSEAAVKEAEAALRRAEHGVTEASSARVEAEVALRLAEVRLELTRIKAPFAGRVLRVFARAGELIGHEGVAELADVSQTGVEAEVNVADIARVRVGAKAEVTLAGRTESFRGVVESISWRVTAGALADENPSAFRDLRVVRVRIALDTAGTAALAPLTGAQAQVKILR
jgi:HlyD family secretion protein